MSAIDLSVLDLGLAALLLVVNGAISLAFGLRLETSLAVAAVRMVVQLAAVGLVLKFVFAQSSPLWTLAIAVVMVAVAGWEVSQRQERRFAQGGGGATGSATRRCFWQAGSPRSTRSSS